MPGGGVYERSSTNHGINHVHPAGAVRPASYRPDEPPRPGSSGAEPAEGRCAVDDRDVEEHAEAPGGEVSAVLAKPMCDRRRRPGPELPAVPCGGKGTFEAIVHCTGHDATTSRVLCAGCVARMTDRPSRCKGCQTRTVVIVGILRTDGVA